MYKVLITTVTLHKEVPPVVVTVIDFPTKEEATEAARIINRNEESHMMFSHSAVCLF